MVELLAYTEFAVQNNALEVVMSSIDATSASSFVTKRGFIDAYQGRTDLCSVT